MFSHQTSGINTSEALKPADGHNAEGEEEDEADQVEAHHKDLHAPAHHVLQAALMAKMRKVEELKAKFK